MNSYKFVKSYKFWDTFSAFGRNKDAAIIKPSQYFIIKDHDNSKQFVMLKLKSRSNDGIKQLELRIKELDKHDKYLKESIYILTNLESVNYNIVLPHKFEIDDKCNKIEVDCITSEPEVDESTPVVKVDTTLNEEVVQQFDLVSIKDDEFNIPMGISFILLAIFILIVLGVYLIENLS